MKLEAHTVRLRLAEPLRISRSVLAGRDAVQVTVRHEGLAGHGEVVTSTYLELPADLIHRQLGRLGPSLARYPGPGRALAGLRGGAAEFAVLSPGVRAAAESALLDLAGLRTGTPVHRMLGAPTPPAAATARTIGITDPVRAAAAAARLAADGFALLKVKAGSADRREDLARVGAVRTAAPGARLLLDPNGAWTPEEAPALLREFADLGVEAVEQPIAPGRPDLLAAIAGRSPLPVIADEDAVGFEDAVRLAGHVHGVNIKLAKCGGIGAALRICEALRGSGTAVMLGCLTASSLGIAPAVHLVDHARWVDLDGHLLLAHDPWQGIGGTDGRVRTTSRPGLGVTRAAAPA